MKDGTPYMPSNGSEGDAFEGKWCNRCKKQYDADILCDILASALFYGTQPTEWVYDNGVPTCTAFNRKKAEEQEEEDRSEESKDPNQLNLFD
jgi:hypothetical protein